MALRHDTATLTRRQLAMGAACTGMALFLSGCDAGRQAPSKSDSAEGKLWDHLIVESKTAPDGFLSDDSIRIAENAMTSNLMLQGDALLVGAAQSVRSIDAATGKTIATFTFPAGSGDDGELGNAIGLAADESGVYLLTDLAWLLACSPDMQRELWRTRLADREAIMGYARPIEVRPNYTGQQEDSSADDAWVSLSPARWVCTDMPLDGRMLYVGVTSFQLDGASLLFGVSLEDGTVAWQRDYDLSLAKAGCTGYPALAGYRLLLPIAELGGVAVLSADTGKEIERVETVGPVHMGFTADADNPGVFYTQTRTGAVYRLAVSGTEPVSVSSVDLSEDGKVLASGARPLLHDGLLYAQAPTADKRDDTTSKERDTLMGFTAVIDAETMELVERRRSRELETTPVMCDGRLCYVGWQGLYAADLDFADRSDFSLISEEEARPRDTWDQQVLERDGVLYLLVGNTSRWRVHALGL